jgi:hypothetical protein
VVFPATISGIKISTTMTTSMVIIRTTEHTKVEFKD